MRDDRKTELTAYFAGLGMQYDGNRRAWHKNGQDWLSGPYRGVMLRVTGERSGDGMGNSGRNNVTNNPNFYLVYRNYLQVSVEAGPPVGQPVMVLPRNEYALVNPHGNPVVNGNVILAAGNHIIGTDILRSQYIAVNRMLDTGVPEFDAGFGVLCDDEAYAWTVLNPELLRWIAGDQRSQRVRVMFKEDRVDAFLRTEPDHRPDELFVPEWIFPVADYLIELVGHAPGRSLRPA